MTPFNKVWERRLRDPPDVDAAARDFLRLKYVRGKEGEPETATIGHGKALVDLEEKPEGLIPRGGPAPTDPSRFFRHTCVSLSTVPGPATC